MTTERHNSPDGSRPKQRAKSARTRSALLAAAAEVVRADGVAALTLDRVADAAGVSKGGLLYHFSSKQALVVALLESTLDAADTTIDGMADTQSDEPGAFARAYLDYVCSDDTPRDVDAASIFAAAALQEGDLAPAQRQFERWQTRLVDDDGLDETTALLARVVGDGLWLIDLFGLAPPSPEQRRRLRDRIVEGFDR